MPRYVPLYDEMEEMKPCIICGEDVLEENEETCSTLCRELKKSNDEDWAEFQYEDLQEDPWEENTWFKSEVEGKEKNDALI